MNKKSAILLGVVAFFVLVPGCLGVSYYNRLVRLHETIGESWSQVDNVLQRRYDLIPNLVSTVKGYAKHEASVLEEVTRLRSQWGEAKTPEARREVAQGLEGALSRLMVVVEKYPDLKANQNFLALQDELAGTENRIAVERMRYNVAVKEYNVLLRRFPSNIVAGLTGFGKSERGYFEATQGAQTAPQVNF